MLDTIKSILSPLLHPLLGYLENTTFVQFLDDSGFFYEYGAAKSVLTIAIYTCISMLLARGLIAGAVRKANIYPTIWISLIGGIWAYTYLSYIKLSDFAYFYPPTTLHRIENIYGLSICYGMAMGVYYSFYNAVFGNANKIWAYLCTAAIITAPLQIWVLFSSSTRDFLRAPVLTLFFILIAYVIRQKINFSNRTIFLCSALMVGAMTFRQDILLYFPLFIMAIVFFDKNPLKVRLLIALKMTVFFIPGYLFLTSGLFHTLETASGRFIPGIGEDVIRTFYGEPSSYIGPFNDQTADVIVRLRHPLEAGAADSVHEKIAYFYNFISEYCTRLPVILVDTYESPMTSNYYPPFFDATLTGQALNYFRAIFSENYFFIVALFFMVWGLRQHIKLLIFIILSALYLSLFNGLLFYAKSIFHLELFSYLILAFGSYQALVCSKSIYRFVLKARKFGLHA